MSSVLGDVASRRPFEIEWLGHDRDRQRATLTGLGSDDGRGAGARPAPESGSHEHEIRPRDGSADAFGVLLGGAAADLRISA